MFIAVECADAMIRADSLAEFLKLVNENLYLWKEGNGVFNKLLLRKVR